MKRILIVFVLMFILSSCSVFMAANKSGLTLEDIQTCKTRYCIISKGVEVISSKKLNNGDLVEIYKIQKQKGSIARAAMHGVLDIATLGVWEAAGTPIEGALGNKKYFAIRITYSKDENIKKIEILN